ncbi:hypothetical protein ACIRH0_12675 [Streptomyces sp. NPDC093675]|uniref:hypothetical protein n=1 Tax=Streptomyces sp. NPDC093675 TaxID=3366049 RepID=UPI003803A470
MPVATMPLMQSAPLPCPAHLIPDATDADAFHAAYRAAKAQHVVFVGIELQGWRWAVKVDALTAPEHVAGNLTYQSIQAAITHLIRKREIRPESSASPLYIVLNGVVGEDRARELAAALHAALYGDLELLARAVS